MTQPNEDNGLLELADVMARLGREFKRAAEADEPTIEWYGATVELESVVERSADGGIRFWVVSGGAKAGDRDIVKVTVNLALFGESRWPAECRGRLAPRIRDEHPPQTRPQSPNCAYGGRQRN